MIIAPIVLSALVSAGSVAPAPTELTPDKPVKVGDVEVVCTGVGLEARQNAAWESYPLKVEIAGRGGQFLGDVQLSISQGGRSIASVTCGGPWLLFRLAAGKYQVDGETEGKAASSSALVPAVGQARIILRYPELGGAIEVPLSASAATPALTQ